MYKKQSIAVFCMPLKGHFQRVKIVVAGLIKSKHEITVFTDIDLMAYENPNVRRKYIYLSFGTVVWRHYTAQALHAMKLFSEYFDSCAHDTS